MDANYSEALEQQLALARRLAVWPGRRGAIEKNAQMLLGRSESFYVPTDIGNMLYGASQSLPEWPLSSADHPVPCGFAWFERSPFPLVNDLSDGRKEVGELCALLWGGNALIKTESEGLVEGVCIEIIGRREGMVIPWFETTWRYGESYESAVERGRAPSTVKHYAIDPSTDEEVAIEQAMRLVASLWLFTQQTVLTTNRETVDRHARKRLARLDCPEDTVRVVRLRRPARSDGQGPNETSEWSCQWIVRGHWRQQFYPSKHANQPIWITPYVKGPEDKPLKAPRTTVFAVVR